MVKISSISPSSYASVTASVSPFLSKFVAVLTHQLVYLSMITTVNTVTIVTPEYHGYYILVNNQNHIQNLFTLYQIAVSASHISLDLQDHHVVCFTYYPCGKDTTILKLEVG